MKRLITITLLFYYLLGHSQVFFSNVYKVPEDKTGLTNYFPNWLSSVFPTDSLIFAFGYSADTTYKDIFGTAFYMFDWKGSLLDYYHIKDDSLHNFFYPEGIHTWDGIVFYTTFNNNYKEQSILKFNRITRNQEDLIIDNSIIKGGDILRGNMSVTQDSCLLTASEIAIDSTGFNYKIQVTKINTSGNLIWQKILGRDPGNGYQNHCFSSYVDKYGDVLIGVGYSDNSGLGWPADYQSLLYKLNNEGESVSSANSMLSRTGLCYIYDIVEGDNKKIYLLADYNYNEPQYPYANRGYGMIQVLDSAMKFKNSVPLNFAATLYGHAIDNIFDKIVKSNDSKGVIIGGDVSYKEKVIIFNNSNQRYDSIEWRHDILHPIKFDYSLNLLWKKVYRIRNGKDDGYLYDLKSCPSGGYIIAAASYLDDAKEKYGDPYYMPWLLRVDDDGCLIPGCGTVSNKELPDSKDKILIYPNPATNYIVILHSGKEKTHYQIISAEGKIMDEFYSFIEGEQIIVPIDDFQPGSYFVKAESKRGGSSEVFIKQ
ncbi:MAG: T9SS type A sorting domain-containing protein [Saprospiraceae bacterium]|nr:T9SS type A sorting domain-containing protein [Saprospiraceae bacterium]